MEALKDVPDGFLHIAGKYGNNSKYYQRHSGSNAKNIYIKKKDIDLVRKLAQKDYDIKVLEAVREELKVLNKFLKKYSELDIHEIYNNLHPERKKLITPILESDEMFLDRWQSCKYEPSDYKEENLVYSTLNNEMVRSKSECLIANLLLHKGIPYHYEKPLTLSNGKIVFPDFTLLDIRHRKELYLEHLGMMDKPEYVERNIRKLQDYERSGIFIGKNLLLTYETEKTPLDLNLVDKMLDSYFNK